MYEEGGEAYPFDEYMIRAGRELGMNELKKQLKEQNGYFRGAIVK